jgi:lipopolysaccharide/colanic/teichoic acid biosynthesis glycosyltransferase
METEMKNYGASLRLKRLFDISVASLALVLVAPLFPFIALAIKLDSRGPVFFWQLRVGGYHRDRVDLLYKIKFRSMCSDAEKSTGAVWAQKTDPRITATGMFLRKSRLDELPQLINVLKGDMSIIGPRPERPGFYQNLENNIPFYADRTYGLRPGITGLAQVYQGYDTCIEDVRSKVAYDHSYALALDSVPVWIATDVKIVFMTLWVMLRGRGQ